MDHDRGKEQNRRHDRDAPSQTVAPTRIVCLKMSGEGERDQKSDQQPTVMQADLDAKNTAEFDLRFHLTFSCLLNEPRPLSSTPNCCPDIFRRTARAARRARCDRSLPCNDSRPSSRELPALRWNRDNARALPYTCALRPPSLYS